MPLPDLAAVDEFFASLAWSDDMYGWKFLDNPEATVDWPAQVSLDLALGGAPDAHRLHWFNECGRDESGEAVLYCIEGVIEFEDLAVQLADGTPIALADFVSAGRRWWHGLYGGDPRVSPTAQIELGQPPSWRPDPSAGPAATDITR